MQRPLLLVIGHSNYLTNTVASIKGNIFYQIPEFVDLFLQKRRGIDIVRAQIAHRPRKYHI